MKTQTHVVELKDLYSLIPECRSLEHKNFTDLKQLLTTLIKSVESAKNWEFVQYISNKPSLFVVRYRENESYTNPSIYSTPEPSYAPAPSTYEEREDEMDDMENSYQEEAPAPKKDKLPWE